MAETAIRPLIPLMRPLLTKHEYIIPYLRKIDENRWYSNFGPLVRELEARMTEMFGTGPDSVVSVGNGTAGLTNILRAMDLPRGNFCIVPAWTFIATPASVIASGLVPYFMDVDENTWALDPKMVKAQVMKLGGKVSAVMVVAPFGAPQDTQAWDDFTDETGIPVIIDAAAGFDAFSSVSTSQPRKNPVMISLHATKMFGIGEGGLVISTNTTLIKRVQEMSNFGFSGKKEIRVPGTNGKMCEYNAAVALATHDLWPQMREYWMGRKWGYLKKFSAFGQGNPGLSDDWAASTFNVRLPKPNAVEVIAKLTEAGIESRQWWGRGCHVHEAYNKFPREPIPVTEHLANSVIALPFTLDIEEKDIDYIANTLLAICGMKPN